MTIAKNYEQGAVVAMLEAAKQGGGAGRAPPPAPAASASSSSSSKDRDSEEPASKKQT